MSKDARKALDTVGLKVREDVLVEGLPIGYKQFIEIAREMDKTGMKVLVFDEPTAVLTEDEAEQMLSALRKIVASGIGVIFISHRLDEVLGVADRITVLRDGELVTTLGRGMTRAKLAEPWSAVKSRAWLLGLTPARAASATMTSLFASPTSTSTCGEQVNGVNLKSGRVRSWGSAASPDRAASG